MEKKKYIIPVIELVELDNDISLELQSNPPIGPDETRLSSEFQNNNPYKNLLG